MIVDAQSLLPIGSVKIYDAENNILGTSGQNGFFKITIDYTKTGAINFKLKFVKKDYQVLKDQENWADFPHGTKTVMYFGLQGLRSEVKSFATIDDASFTGNKLDYNQVIAHFDKIKKRQEFENQLAKAKVGNQKVFFQIDGQFFIVDSNGWIKLKSGQDSIFVNKKQVVPANQLNFTIKRKNVKGISPLDMKGHKFVVYTNTSSK